MTNRLAGSRGWVTASVRSVSEKALSTWLEEAGIPARVIDELMGHRASGGLGGIRQVPLGPLAAHRTRDGRRVVAAVEERLVVVLATAEAALDRHT